MDEKRFPPPGDHAGYREPAPRMADDPLPPEAPVARHHVVASRPSEPDLAIQRAATEAIAAKQEALIAARERELRRETMTRVLVVVAVLFVAICLSWWLVQRPRHVFPLPPPPASRV